MGVSDQAMAAHTVSPPRCDGDMVAFLQTRHPRHGRTDLVHDSGDFVPESDWRRDVVVLAEVAVDELNVGSAHATGFYVDEDFVRLNVRYWHVFEDRRSAILMHTSCFHACVLS